MVSLFSLSFHLIQHVSGHTHNRDILDLVFTLGRNIDTNALQTCILLTRIVFNSVLLLMLSLFQANI